jgi:DNA polymerase-3 subunit gamma/tau
MYQPIHHKYRPQSFAQLVGQSAIAQTLTNAIATNRIAPAYLFTGSRGTGKTSSARILAKSLNCTAGDLPTSDPCGECNSCIGIAKGISLDVTELDAASNSGVDNIRELIERCQFAPVETRYKVYVIDEVHSLSSQAFQALLKTLEEPPANVVFVLCTTEVQKVPLTIASRCQRFDFKRIGLEAMVDHLSFIAKKEFIDATPEAIRLVAQLSNGGLRDAETLLDQLSLREDAITPEMVRELVGSVKEQDLLSLLRAISCDDSKELLVAIRRILQNGKDALTVLQNVAGIFRDLLIAKNSPTQQEMVALTVESWQTLCEIVSSWNVSTILQAQQHLRESEAQVKLSTVPQLWLEIAILGLLPSARNSKPTIEIKQIEPAAAIWAGWKKPTDAIAWAHQELPHLSLETLQQYMDSLKPIKGKKAPAWVEFVEKQKVR